MGYQDEVNRGRHAGGYEHGNDAFNEGARQRRNEQRFQESMRPVQPPPSAPPPAQGSGSSFGSNPAWPAAAGSESSSNVGISSSQWTLVSAAKSGAILLGVIGVLIAYLGSKRLDVATFLEFGAIGAIGGAVAGTVLYVAVKILIFAIKVAVIGLVAGIVLHLMGVIDLPRALGRLAALIT